jgi:hypothetical protein
MLPFAVALLAAPEPVSMSYSGPKERAGATLDQFSFTEWTAGEIAYVAVHESNLREKPDAAAASLALLPLATEVKVEKAASARVKVGERVDLWYEVSLAGKRGFIFGGALTKAAFTASLDDDPELERITVAWAPNYKIRVRVLDGATLLQHDLDPGGQAYACCGGVLTPSLVEAKTAGVALLEVKSNVEACGDYLIAYVSYTGGKLRTALETSGLSDPPVHAEPQITFQPKKRAAVVTTVTTEEAEDGTTSTDETVKRYAYRDGVYEEAK